MSVSTTNSTQVFAGGQSVLTFNFRTLVSNPNYIQVNVMSGSTVTPLVYNVGYTVAVNASGVGGTVTVSPTYGSQYTYIVYRQTAVLQGSAYSDYNQFPASTLENNLDQLTMIEQENVNKGYFSYPIGTSTTYSTTIPVPSGGTVLEWDPTGTFLMNSPPGPSGATGPIGPSGSTGSVSSVSSSTTDVTVVSTSTTPIITAVNAATAGNNVILRLTSTGLLPALNASKLTNVTASTNAIQNGNQFGSNIACSFSTVYLASTDGMVSGYVTNSSATSILEGITDSNPTPSTIVISTFCTGTNVGGLSFSVKKGESWQFAATNFTTPNNLFFRPSGS